MASMAAHHAEWLSLMDVSGPFLSVPVLKDALPNGLDAHDPHIAAEVRAALEEWADPDAAALGSVDQVEVHLAFVRFVLHDVLGFEDDVLRWDDDTTSKWSVEVPQVGDLRPDAVLVDDDAAVMLVAVYGPGVRVDEIVPELGMSTPQERMVEHLKATGLRVGLVTDGERWTLVSYQERENPGFATWWSSLWGEEKITLQAFRTLLHQDRFLTLGEDDTIAGLLDRSAEDQREVTTKLGNQTLEAVEILIRTIDRIDHERGGGLLADVPVEELYDAAVTVMMRLIFLFYAEENELLPVAEPLYNERYAASTLRERLQAAADEHGEEVLESTQDGWPRLLAAWRAVFGGVEHGAMVLAPYGGSLFDPDRYPFLEGRLPGTLWSETEADPLPIDNRTVLHLLNALQTLDEGGQRRKLSFRALDVEQIGHVYEGMLDHTAARAKGWVLGLSGTGGKAPEIELGELEAFMGDKALFEFLKERTGRTPATLKKWCSDDEADNAVTRYGATWAPAFPDPELESRVHRFAKLVREDSTGAPTAFQPGSVYVADSSHRGATGTHYTPRSLTEEIVKQTLDPLLYTGPADGTPEDQWDLLTPEEILDLKVCDPACGSGAFLVQVCRYLADAVVKSARVHGHRSDAITEDEIIEARRRVAERCLHGVDINPMACEMAKLSLWLITLAHDRPFTFLDHAIRCGDSLLGIKNIDELVDFALDEGRRELALFGIGETVELLLREARDISESLAAHRTDSIADLRVQRSQLARRDELLGGLSDIGDLLVAIRLSAGDQRSFERARSGFLVTATGVDPKELMVAARRRLSVESRGIQAPIKPLHWPLVFPAVMSKGFDAVVSNPPYLGGGRIATSHGSAYRAYLADVVARGRRGMRGRADLCAYFLRRSCDIAQGMVGLVVTNSIAETDTRAAGLESVMDDGWQVAAAATDEPWPGEATVVISKVWLTSLDWTSPCLNGHRVHRPISSSLTVGPVDAASLVPISHVVGRLIQGSALNGDGFLVEPALAQNWLNDDPKNADVLRPFLTGADVTDERGSGASRFAVCFWDWPENRAAQYVAPFEHVKRTVKAEREAKGSDGWRRRDFENYWLFHTLVPEIYNRANDADWVVVLPRVAKHVVPVRTAATQVFSNTLLVAPDSDWGRYGLLLSSVHREWAHATAARMGSSGVQYSTSSCFNTLWQPRDWSKPVGQAAEYLDSLRTSALEETRFSLTKLNNCLGDPSFVASWALDLRQAQQRLDQAVIEDCLLELVPEWGFVEGPNERFSIVGKSRDALLAALAAKNAAET